MLLQIYFHLNDKLLGSWDHYIPTLSLIFLYWYNSKSFFSSSNISFFLTHRHLIESRKIENSFPLFILSFSKFWRIFLSISLCKWTTWLKFNNSGVQIVLYCQSCLLLLFKEIFFFSLTRVGKHPCHTSLANSDPEQTWEENVKTQKNPRK